MNEFFESLGKRWRKAAERRGAKIEQPELDEKVAAEILELARVAAHTKERRFAPLPRGASPLGRPCRTHLPPG